MNHFDLSILTWLDRCGLRGETWDPIISQICDNLLVKGGIIVAVIWCIWFTRGDNGGRDPERAARVRRRILAGFVGTFLALVSTRAAQIVFPYRPRPIVYAM